MSSFPSNEIKVTNSQPDADMNQANSYHEAEPSLLEAAQVIARGNATTPPPTQKSEQRRHVVQPRSSQSNSKSSKIQVGEQIQEIPEEDVVEQEADTEDDDQLARLDWVELERRYREALIKANNTEDELTDRFDAIADSFQIWSQTAAHRVNERAQKRLRTRITHVQLSEQDLEYKIHKYDDVVQAFKAALELLRRPMAIR